MDSRTRRLVTLGVLAALVVAVLIGAFVDRAEASRPGAAAAAGQGAAAAERALAERYVPYVVVRVQEEECGPGEPYRPVPVDSVLGDPQVVLRGPDGQKITQAPSPEDLAGLGDGYYLDFPGEPLSPGCDYEEWFRGKQDVPTAVHARVVPDPQGSGTLVVQYWFWWVYNDWNDKHEGDWEMIQLLFPAEDARQALTVSPTEVAFAQHEGSEVSAWDDPKLLREGDHVAVYPGQGSHAAYYTQARWFGKSAAAGFGCDNTSVSDGLSATVLQPEVRMLDAQPWLTFSGRWGQKAPSFNNGPTGPNTKDQWDAPVTWQIEEGRSSAVALPVVLSAAEESFCTLTGAGSLLFIDLLANPVGVLVGLALAILAIVLLVRSTTWRGGAGAVDRTRTAGQILAAPAGILRRNAVRYLPVAVVVGLALMASYATQTLLLRPEPTGDLAAVGAPGGSVLDIIVIALVAIGTLVVASWAVARVVAITAGTAGDPETGAGPRATRHGTARTLLTYVVIAACGLTIILVPVALYLVGRWSVATPAAVVEDLPAGAAGQRSADLVRGRWWRAFAIMVASGIIAVAPGALLGAVLLLLTGWSFPVVNTAVVCLTAVMVVYAAVAMTLHFYDLRARHADRASTVPEEVGV